MLLLSRKCQEVIVITPKGFESPIKVTVIEIRGGSVKLGFEADPAIPIHRDKGGHAPVPLLL